MLRVTPNEPSASIPERQRSSYDVLLRDVRAFVHRRIPSTADADDVVQEVLLRVVRGLGHLDDHARLHGWVYRIARNTIADHYRSRRIEVPHSVEPPDPSAPMDPLEGDPAGVLAAWLKLAVNDLAEPYRRTLQLTELQGLDYAEVARREGVSVSAVKSRVARGRRQLRQALLRCCQVELDARGRVAAYTPRGSCGC